MSICASALISILCLLVGYRIGWQSAHLTVATECERLGKFYVGKKIFECVEITKHIFREGQNG